MHNWGRFYATVDIDDTWQELYSTILPEADRMCPMKTFNISCSKKPPWFNDELIKLAANRDKFYFIGKAKNDERVLAIAREYRKRVKTKIANSRSVYYQTELEANKANPLTFWEHVKNILPGEKCDNKISVVREYECDKLCAPVEAPTIINEYFTSIGPSLAQQIPNSFDPQTRRPQIRTLKYEPDIPVS